jgi:hypothetical protein
VKSRLVCSSSPCTLPTDVFFSILLCHRPALWPLARCPLHPQPAMERGPAAAHRCLAAGGPYAQQPALLLSPGTAFLPRFLRHAPFPPAGQAGPLPTAGPGPPLTDVVFLPPPTSLRRIRLFESHRSLVPKQRAAFSRICSSSRSFRLQATVAALKTLCHCTGSIGFRHLAPIACVHVLTTSAERNPRRTR